MNSSVDTIIEAINMHAVNNPDKICIADIDKQFTYKGMVNAINSLVIRLREAGVKRGDKVVLRGNQKAEFFVIFYSLHMLGAVVCPIERAVKEDRILEIMELLDSKLYITDRKIKSELITQLIIKDLNVAELAKESCEVAGQYPDKNDLAEILFTTGTTGKSKGIEVTHECDIAIAQNVIDSVEMTVDEVEILTTPVSHSLAIRRTMGAMYIGSTVIISDGVRYVKDFLQLCARYGATAVTFVPAILEQLLLMAKDEFEAFNNQISYIQLGSAPLSEKNKAILCEMFPNSRLYNTYGATESGCTVILEFSKYKDKENCIGRTTVNTNILFVDDDRRQVQCSMESPALLAFDGKMNMSGYYKEPELTKEVLDENYVVYTNDLGYRGEDGLIYLLGRRGEVINVGGIKVSPNEVEGVAVLHPSVRDCACIPVDDSITGNAIKMYVVPEDGCEFVAPELLAFMAERLEKLKLPKYFEVTLNIPRTFNGKIIRKELIERDKNGQ